MGIWVKILKIEKKNRNTTSQAITEVCGNVLSEENAYKYIYILKPMGLLNHGFKIYIY